MNPCDRLPGKSVILGIAFLAFAFASPAFAQQVPASPLCDSPDEDYAVYKRVVESRVPHNPACQNGVEPECDQTARIAWEFGPVPLDTGANNWGDACYYRLVETYEIDLKPYIDDYELFHPGDLPDECTDPVNKDFWSEHFIEDYSGDELRLRDLVLQIRRGYRWDGPSLEIPPTLPFQFNRTAAKPFGLMRASLVHDALYGFPRRFLVAFDGPDFRQDFGGSQFRLMADCILYMLTRQDSTRKGGSIPIVDGGTAENNHGFVRFGGWIYTQLALPDWKFHALANAGGDQEIECASPDGIDVELDGSRSRDVAIFHWDYGLGTSDDEQPTVHFPVGIHPVTLTVDDGDDFLNGPFGDSDEIVVTVTADTGPPVIHILSKPQRLWPPNRQFETIHVQDFVATVSDNCVTLAVDDVVITAVSSNEAAVGDILISPDGKSVALRKERSGRGDGRVYTINVQVVDDAGMAGFGSYQVHVPRRPGGNNT